MYGRRASGELKQSELEEARLGFIQFLRRKRFSPQFIESHGEDLFATAALEYSRKLSEGERIESPPGWLITCAWRRTMSLLEAQGRSPQVLPTEQAEAIEDELGKSPEQTALDEDRFRRVHDAVEQLSKEERQVLELAYFEELPVREVARQLDWHPSKAQRRHEAAREHLHTLLGVDSLDELEVIVGLAAYVSFTGKSSGIHLPSAAEALAEGTTRLVASAWARAQEIARRVPSSGGSDSSAAVLGGGAGRAAGVCATAALACLASGVVGPGLGGVNLMGGRDQPATQKPLEAATSQPIVAAKPKQPIHEAPAPRRVESSDNRSASPDRSASTTPRQRHQKQATEAVDSQSLESAAAPPEEASSPPVEPASTGSVSSDGPEASTSSSSSSPTQVANEQFGP